MGIVLGVVVFVCYLGLNYSILRAIYGNEDPGTLKRIVIIFFGIFYVLGLRIGEFFKKFWVWVNELED